MFLEKSIFKKLELKFYNLYKFFRLPYIPVAQYFSPLPSPDSDSFFVLG